MAMPVADGLIQASDGYDFTYLMNVEGFSGKKGDVFEGSSTFTLNLHQDGDKLYAGLLVPFSVTDNNYGDPEGINNNGWLDGKNAHTLKNLTGSDSTTEITVAAAGNAEVKYDYTEVYDSLGLDAGVSIYNTSLSWNWQNLPGATGDNSPSAGDPEYATWLFDVAYEFVITLADATPLDLSLVGLNSGTPAFEIAETHTSPTKDLGGKIVWKPVGLVPLVPVPIPAAVWLFGSGLIGLLGFGRRKMK